MADKTPTHSDKLLDCGLRYVKDLYQELSIQRSVKSPISTSFQEWVRKLNGFKTLGDLNNENTRKYLLFVFLCDHNFMFNLLAHNRQDLIQLYLDEVTKGDDIRAEADEPVLNHNTEVAQSILSIPPTATTTIDTELYFLAVEAVKAQERQLAQLIMWEQLYYQIRVERCQVLIQNRVDVIHAVTPFLENLVQNLEIDFSEAIQADLAALILRHQDRVRLVDDMQHQAFETIEAHEENLENIKQITDEDEKDINNFLDTHPDSIPEATQKEIREVHADARNKYNQADQKFNAMMEPIKARCDMLLGENRVSKRAFLESLQEKLTEAQHNMGELDEVLREAFDSIQTTIASVSEAIENTSNGQEIQSALGECALKLNEFLENFGNLPETLKAIEKAQQDLEHFALPGAERLNIPIIAQQVEAVVESCPIPAIEVTPVIEVTGSMREGVQTIREDSKNDAQKKIEKLMSQFEEAKTDEDDPLEISAEDEAKIDSLFQELTATAEDGSLDGEKLVELKGICKGLKRANPENEELKDFFNELNKITKQARPSGPSVAG